MAELTPNFVDADDLNLPPNPLKHVSGLSGVRVEDVGQGDAISILDNQGRPVLRIDYGGVQSTPFTGMARKPKRRAINVALPVHETELLMLTHWDEDHWASAVELSLALRQTPWLVPRQWTSPSAVERSLRVRDITCIPRAMECSPTCFVAQNGDQLWWEKLKYFDRSAMHEDCNRSGVAFSIVHAHTGRVIFLPGDAPYHLPKHYQLHAQADLTMRGLVAFHHGAGTHWANLTRRFLRRWRDPSFKQTLVYSVGGPNRDNHPVTSNYDHEFPQAQFPLMEVRRTAMTPSSPRGPVDIMF